MQPEPDAKAKDDQLGGAVYKIAGQVAQLDSGPAAMLRRDQRNGVGAPAFWKIWADCNLSGNAEREARWAVFVQCVALITPKGERKNRTSVQDGKIRFGAVLRGGEKEPLYSELRLMRLLNAPWDQRPAAALRLARWLANKNIKRVDLRPLAAYLLYENDRAARQIAREYYGAPVDTPAQEDSAA